MDSSVAPAVGAAVCIFLLGMISAVALMEYTEQTAEFTTTTISKTYDQSSREVIDNRTTIEKRDVIQRNTYNYDKLNYQAHTTEVNYEEKDTEVAVEKDFCWELYGRSMQPAAWDGNLLCFKEVDGDEIEQGDVVAYEKDGKNKVHAVVGDYAEWDYYSVNGYSNFESEKVDPSEIKGVLVATVYTG
jgi:hypothetical protein